MKKIKSIIIDDEPFAIEILNKYVQGVDALEMVGAFRNAVDALSFLQTHEVDLIFLDIEMPRISGISFIKLLENPPLIILTTAYREYAVEGFELDVLDYLLKPISLDRFQKALRKILSPNRHLPAEAAPSRPYLFLKSGKKVVQVFLDNILYIESLSNYARIFLASGGSLVSYQKMSYLQEILPEDQFIRIHRSFIVCKDYISEFSLTNLVVNNLISLPISNTYRARVKKLIV